MFACGPVDASHCHPNKTPSSLASFKSRLVVPFWYRLIQVVLEKRPLNCCSSSSSSAITVVMTFSFVCVLRCDLSPMLTVCTAGCKEFHICIRHRSIPASRHGEEAEDWSSAD